MSVAIGAGWPNCFLSDRPHIGGQCSLPSLRGLRLHPGQPDIPYLKPAPLKDAPRPVLRQLKNSPVAMYLDQPPTSDDL
jgi:hypothetical protein